jgi:predicted secreted protein
MSKDSIDVTNRGTSTNQFKEAIPGLKDGGSVSFKCNWLPTNSTHDGTTGIVKVFKDNVNHNWKCILPDAIKTIAFTGHVTAYTPETPMAAQGSFSATIKVSGEPTGW